MSWSNDPSEHEPTQLDAIRTLMLEATARGDWLTLAEIAGATEFGEASISAQLRHLRKRQHGRYLVEKRRRAAERDNAACHAVGTSSPTRWSGETRGTETCASDSPWEYSVRAPLDRNQGAEGA